MTAKQQTVQYVAHSRDTHINVLHSRSANQEASNRTSIQLRSETGWSLEILRDGRIIRASQDGSQKCAFPPFTPPETFPIAATLRRGGAEELLLIALDSGALYRISCAALSEAARLHESSFARYLANNSSRPVHAPLAPVATPLLAESIEFDQASPLSSAAAFAEAGLGTIPNKRDNWTFDVVGELLSAKVEHHSTPLSAFHHFHVDASEVVVAQNQSGELFAIDEHGGCHRLDDGVGRGPRHTIVRILSTIYRTPLGQGRIQDTLVLFVGHSDGTIRRVAMHFCDARVVPVEVKTATMFDPLVEAPALPPAPNRLLIEGKHLHLTSMALVEGSRTGRASIWAALATRTEGFPASMLVKIEDAPTIRIQFNGLVADDANVHHPTISCEESLQFPTTYITPAALRYGERLCTPLRHGHTRLEEVSEIVKGLRQCNHDRDTILTGHSSVDDSQLATDRPTSTAATGSARRTTFLSLKTFIHHLEVVGGAVWVVISHLRSSSSARKSPPRASRRSPSRDCGESTAEVTTYIATLCPITGVARASREVLPRVVRRLEDIEATTTSSLDVIRSRSEECDQFWMASTDERLHCFDLPAAERRFKPTPLTIDLPDSGSSVVDAIMEDISRSLASWRARPPRPPYTSFRQRRRQEPIDRVEDSHWADVTQSNEAFHDLLSDSQTHKYSTWTDAGHLVPLLSASSHGRLRPPNPQSIKEAAMRPHLEHRVMLRKLHATLWMWKNVVINHRARVFFNSWRRFSLEVRLARKRRLRLITAFQLQGDNHGTHMKERFATWRQNASFTRERKRLVLKIAQRRVETTDTMLRKTYMGRWIMWRRTRFQSRVCENLLSGTVEGRRRLVFRRWINWVEHHKARLQRSRAKNFITRYLHAHSKKALLTTYFRKLKAFPESRKNVEMRRAALLQIVDGMGAGGEKLTQRYYWSRWSDAVRKRQQQHRRRCLTETMATLSSRSLMRLSWSKLLHYSVWHKTKRQNQRVAAIALFGRTQDALRRLRFGSWNRFVVGDDEEHRRKRALRALRALSTSTEFGMRLEYFRKWSRKVSGKRKLHPIEHIIRQTRHGLCVTYYYKWMRFHQQVISGHRKRNSLGVLLRASDQGLRTWYFFKWMKLFQVHRQGKNKRALVACLGRSTEARMRYIYFTKWRGLKALRLKRVRQGETSERLLTRTEALIARRTFRRWMVEIMRGFAVEIAAARSSTEETERAVRHLDEQHAQLEEVREGATASLDDVESDVHRIRRTLEVTESERISLDKSIATKRNEMNALRQELEERLGEEAALRSALGNQLMLLTLSQKQEVSFKRFLEQLDDATRALRDEWLAKHGDLQERRSRRSSPVVRLMGDNRSSSARRSVSPQIAPASSTCTPQQLNLDTPSRERVIRPTLTPRLATSLLNGSGPQPRAASLTPKPSPRLLPPRSSSQNGTRKVDLKPATLAAMVGTPSSRRNLSASAQASRQRRLDEEEARELCPDRAFILELLKPLALQAEKAKEKIERVLEKRLPVDDRLSQNVSTIVHRRYASSLD